MYNLIEMNASGYGSGFGGGPKLVGPSSGNVVIRPPSIMPDSITGILMVNVYLETLEKYFQEKYCERYMEKDQV